MAAAATIPSPPLPLHEFEVASRLVSQQAFLRALFLLRSLVLALFLACHRLLPLASPRFFFLTGAHSSSSSSSSVYHDPPHLLLLSMALFCELGLSLQAHLAIFPRLRYVERVAHPSRLLQQLQLKKVQEMATKGKREARRDDDREGAEEEEHGRAAAAAAAAADDGHHLLLLPPVDVFVTTADPAREPPIIALNTVLSALTLDYPAARLACYVADDGGSILTLWAMTLAAAFAAEWVPFCRAFPLLAPRAPGPHFVRNKAPPPQHHGSAAAAASARDFVSDWTNMKAMYKELELRVSSMTRRFRDTRSRPEAIAMILADLRAREAGAASNNNNNNNNNNNMSSSSSSMCDGADRAAATNTYARKLRHSVVFGSWAASDYDPQHHDAYCEVLIDKYSSNRRQDIAGLPCLVYMSREKSLAHKHHYKAGNMNALIRVSGIFTNAPFILNLDCDMFVNNGEALLQAMCFFMDSNSTPNIPQQLGFLQFPQTFEWVDEGDSPLMKPAIELLLKGWDGAQGPPYVGTCCIHRREVLYGKLPDHDVIIGSTNGLESQGLFGLSTKLIDCTKIIWKSIDDSSDIISSDHEDVEDGYSDPLDVEEAIKLMGCKYEDGTQWGKEVGLIYGTMTEDVQTGLKLHGRGWRSAFYSPRATAFLGSFPSITEDVMNMRKRWSTGFLEVLVGAISPFSFSKHPKMSIIQRLNYIHITGTMSIGMAIPLTIYALLPSASLLIRRPLFPKMEESPVWLLLGIIAFVSVYGCNYVESVMAGVRPQNWWSSERMEAMMATSVALFAAYDVVKKVMGISETNFEVTPKDKLVTKVGEEEEEEEEEEMMKQEEGGFAVNRDCVLFVPPAVMVMLSMVGLMALLLYSAMPMLLPSSSLQGDRGLIGLLAACWGSVAGSVEAWCCMWVLFVLRPFTKGLLLWLVRWPRRRGAGTAADCLHSSVVFRASSFSLLLLCLLTSFTAPPKP